MEDWRKLFLWLYMFFLDFESFVKFFGGGFVCDLIYMIYFGVIVFVVLLYIYVYLFCFFYIILYYCWG